jgi:ribosomal protein L40E
MIPLAKEKEKISLKDNEMLALLKELDNVITCRGCGANLEPDGESCGLCGWKNLLKDCGLI